MSATISGGDDLEKSVSEFGLVSAGLIGVREKPDGSREVRVTLRGLGDQERLAAARTLIGTILTEKLPGCPEACPGLCAFHGRLIGSLALLEDAQLRWKALATPTQTPKIVS